MKRLLIAIALLALSASAAPAHTTKYSWTVAKARVALPEVTTITLPADTRKALEDELDVLLAKFRLLELTAQQDRNDWLAAGTYSNYVRRFSDARERVLNGLSLDSTACTGIGKKLKGNRFKHFRCNATSYTLEVPTVELVEGEKGSLPTVIELPPRRFGPYRAVFQLHVTGRLKCVPQRLS